MSSIGISLHHILHGEESYEYLAPIWSGDRPTGMTTLSEVYEQENQGYIKGTIQATDQQGNVKFVGTSVASLPKRQ